MTDQNKYDAIIIGAGVGGLTVGSLLAKHGKKVLILEQNDRVGGRALSVAGDEITQRGAQWYKDLLETQYTYVANAEPQLEELVKSGMLNGYVLDVGYHALSMNGNAYLYDFVQQIGGIDGVKMNGSHYGTYYKGEFYMDLIGSQPIDPRYLEIAEREKIPFFKYYTTPYKLNDEQIDELERVSLQQWGEEMGLTKNDILWNNLCSVSTLFSTINNPDDISIGDIFRFFKHAVSPKLEKGLCEYVGGFVSGGVMEWSKAVARKYQELGGELALETRVREVVMENGRATGVIAENGSGEKKVYQSEAVVSNVPAQDSFKFMDKSQFPGDWAQKTETMYGYGSYVPYWGLNSLAMPEEHAVRNYKNSCVLPKDEGFDYDVYICWSIQSALDPSVAPDGKYLYTAYLPLTESEARNKVLVDKIVKRLPDFMEEIYPGFKKTIDWKLDLMCWKLEGVAKSVSQAGTQKVPVKSPHVEGLYFAGDTAKGYGVAMDCACTSGMICASEMLGVDFGVR
ncbi:prolycopene isomerase [Desulfatibacillum alkenivorans DSM 16219]|jgi:prolycopene isomerase|uniref:Prolycopene isomerase n=1 Tax=Desulfatibacillum alkenivorans DSM 16219 TaxID=1121393 RepID=A0A1M6UQM2_9BACT|nr:FAD-dependent oxidoreductase [Desulfatibacillum alkenivorans]SHK71517.1 prolycopene isomerase [Desulfatibacillum alkenivorans DSM 16219]